MWLTIDLNSEIALYTQIRNEIIKGIISNSIKENDSLPSVRQLASDLGINLHTVNKAYNLLKQEGFISIHRQKGAVINPLTSYEANDQYILKVKEHLRPTIAEMFCRGVSRKDLEDIFISIYEDYKSLRKENSNNG